MLLTVLVNTVNQKLAGEMLSYKEMLPFLDSVIDAINTDLNTIYPAFSELDQYATEYTAFPDRYLRTVVVPGAAWNFYVTDEEGMQTAQQFQLDYMQNRFYMQRDMLYSIPEEFKANIQQGSIQFQEDIDCGDRGMIIDGNSYLV